MLIITLTIDEAIVTFFAHQHDAGGKSNASLAAFQTIPREDIADLIEAAQTLLADLIANPPNIPELPKPVYTPPPKLDLNAEIEKLLPLVREAAAGWDFSKSKITVKNMIAHLTTPLNQAPKSSETGVEAVLKKLVEEKALKALKYNQFGPPDLLPPPELFDPLDAAEGAALVSAAPEPSPESETFDEPTE